VSALSPEKPLRPNDPPVGITSACEAAPVTNRLLPPVEIMDGTLELTFAAANWSASRPPQPLFDADVLEIEACHWCCWSICEKRLSGFGVVVDRYWALVSGWTSVPTFATTARLPADHSDCSPRRAGCSP
jgi:hypothetical protein